MFHYLIRRFQYLSIFIKLFLEKIKKLIELHFE
jgi:hypothetical protein